MLSSLSIMATDFKDCSMVIKSNISTNIEKSKTTVFINGNTFSINGLKYDNTDLGNVELPTSVVRYATANSAAFST